MMQALRNTIFKGIVGSILLVIMVSKICAFSRSTCSVGSLCPVEKTTEENKEKEEASDKANKKLLLYETSSADHQRSGPVDRLQARTRKERLLPANFPAKNVPTPPPDRLS